MLQHLSEAAAEYTGEEVPMRYPRFARLETVSNRLQAIHQLLHAARAGNGMLNSGPVIILNLQVVRSSLKKIHDLLR